MTYSRRLHLDLWAGIRGVPVFSDPGCDTTEAPEHGVEMDTEVGVGGGEALLHSDIIDDVMIP